MGYRTTGPLGGVGWGAREHGDADRPDDGEVAPVDHHHVRQHQPAPRLTVATVRTHWPAAHSQQAWHRTVSPAYTSQPALYLRNTIKPPQPECVRAHEGCAFGGEGGLGGGMQYWWIAASSSADAGRTSSPSTTSTQSFKSRI
jgi:hypothetical protein